ncbi:hypothetical protein BAU15_14190 [Enterococcus sp. JM4C]|uniref:hypothetical protein n=1 Tax=Candidatus Enterococcus huntleyi TaxID=1857217 RepID=UPI00137A6A0F|nr:hypothetical protein [Enterococcus sp. JM4C]KAF1298829.1 hypothetical protein BAU15_14190 [Enterococcus sp. JM4C]
MKKAWLVVLGLLVTVTLVGCGSKEDNKDKELQEVAKVTYQFVKEKAEKQGAETPRFVEDESNATIYEDKESDLYYILLEKMEKENRTEKVGYRLYKVEKNEDGKYTSKDVEETERHAAKLDSLKKVYEMKNVELQ